MVPGVLDSTLHSSSSFHCHYSLIHGRHECEVDATAYVYLHDPACLKRIWLQTQLHLKPEEVKQVKTVLRCEAERQSAC